MREFGEGVSRGGRGSRTVRCMGGRVRFVVFEVVDAGGEEGREGRSFVIFLGELFCEEDHLYSVEQRKCITSGLDLRRVYSVMGVHRAYPAEIFLERTWSCEERLAIVATRFFGAFDTVFLKSSEESESCKPKAMSPLAKLALILESLLSMVRHTYFWILPSDSSAAKRPFPPATSARAVWARASSLRA